MCLVDKENVGKTAVARATVWAFFLLVGHLATAADLAILWDISKSVPPELYSAKVADTVVGLASGRSLPAGWTRTLPASMPARMKSALEDRAPMVEAGERLLLVRFGTLKPEAGTPAMPFAYWFQEKWDSSDSTWNELRKRFPEGATDQWTNKILAEAAAARYLYEGGSRSAFLVVISDFNQDNPSNLTQEQAEYVDRYEAGSFGAVSPTATLRSVSDNRVQIKVKYVVWSQQEPPAPPQASSLKPPWRQPEPPAPPLVPSPKLLVGLSPVNSAKLAPGSAVVFSWSWRGAESPQTFQVSVRREGSAQAVAVPATRSSSVATIKPLEPGNYRWQVIAFTKEATVSSVPMTFEVEDEPPYWVLLLLAVASVVAAVVISRIVRKKGMARSGR